MDRSIYRRYYELDKKHFWRIGKRRLILEWLENYLPPAEGRKILDIGGACSVISRELCRFGEVLVVEPDEESVALARCELQLDAAAGTLPDGLNVRGQFDVITLLDVLEHVDEDFESLKAIRRVLAPNGIFLLTVPAYQWLWSEHDVVLHHYRRYQRAQLRGLLCRAGFRVERISYYTGLLLPAVVAERLGGRLIHSARRPKYRVRIPNPLVNSASSGIMSVERLLLRYANMPFGSSLVAVASKTAADDNRSRGLAQK